MKDKLRLDYFLSVGGELAVGDECRCKSTNRTLTFKRIIPVGESYPGNYEFTGFGRVVYMKCELDGFTITSFAERENKGVQPVHDDFPVSVQIDHASDNHCAAKYMAWSLDYFYKVSVWKPDHTALLKMQAEHDKHNESIIKACDEANKKESETVYTQEMKDNGNGLTAGMKYLDESGQYCNFVGYCDGGFIVGDLPEFPSLGGRPILSISATANPIKTPEEFELEEAKKKQVDEVCETYSISTGIASLMQQNGHLAEITIPIKSEVKSRDITHNDIVDLMARKCSSRGWSCSRSDMLSDVELLSELGYLSIK